jgi:hydroxyacyl-ACP dehydratase HTD2-like protein with hotdog domain
MYPSELLPDACDDLHYPGEPFVRRMWAGGHVEFPKVNADLLAIAPRQNRQVACKEIIRDVKIKGRDGEEKIFVSIERPVLPIEDSHLSESEELRRVSPIFEHRDLVFMRAKTPEEVKADLARPSRILKPTMLPDVTFKITPDETLLFRFSALTFNAHRIHLDIDYARNVEGYKERLVHGPLSLTMMLKCLTSVLAPGQKISRFTYRNLAPILVNEEMKIQLRKSTTEEKWDVWIENSEGSYAVKGTAEIGMLNSLAESVNNMQMGEFGVN